MNRLLVFLQNADYSTPRLSADFPTGISGIRFHGVGGMCMNGSFRLEAPNLRESLLVTLG
jgi:hypothetical protein